MDELCGPVVIALFMLLIYGLLRLAWKMLTEDYRVSTPGDPVVLDPNNPRDQHEARCIEAQMRTGRELNGYVWKDGGDD
jgi:hypothetical protein